MKCLCLIAGIFYSTICFSFQIKNAQTDSLAFYKKQENPMKAIRYCSKTCTYLLSKNQDEKYCDLMLKKAELYIKLTDFENGFKTLFEAKKIAEKQHLVKKNILITNRISTLYLDTFEFSKSKKYLKESKKLALHIKDNISLESIYSVYFLYHFKTNSDRADYYVKKKQQYIKYVKDPAIIYNYYICLNAYYLSKNETKLFFKYADSALQVAKKMSDKDKISSVKSNICYYYLVNIKDYKKAKRECFEIIAMYPKMDNLNRISDTYLNLSFAYEKLGDYKNALLYTNKYLEIHEDIIKGKLEDKTNDIETKYKIDKAENEFKDKEELNKLEHEKSQKLLLTFASLIILAGFIFYFYYQNLLLNQKNKLKEIDSKLQFKIISATLDGQDQERNKISTVLHDHVSAILSSVGLHLSAFESNLTKPQINDLKNTRTLLKDAHDKVRDLSHQLVPPLLVKFGLPFALKDLCEKNSNSLLKFNFIGAIQDEKRYHAEFETKIYFITSEIFNNIIKHSKASVATLLIEEKAGNLFLVVTDNGKGFDVKSISMSNGFGLTQIRARIKNMNGKFLINSKMNQGTSIEIEVKI